MRKASVYVSYIENGRNISYIISINVSDTYQRRVFHEGVESLYMVILYYYCYY